MNKVSFVFLILLTSALEITAGPSKEMPQISIRKAIETVDSLLAHQDQTLEAKERKIAKLKAEASAATTPEARYDDYKKVYEEYCIFNSDSARVYTEKNRELALQMKRTDLLAETYIQESFCCTAIGLFKEADHAINQVDDPDSLPHELQLSYYDQVVYLNSHSRDFKGAKDAYYDKYLQAETAAGLKLAEIATPADPLYYWYMAWTSGITNNKLSDEQLERFTKLVDSLSFNCRNDAMLSFGLALALVQRGETERSRYYETLAAISDLRIVNRETATIAGLLRNELREGNLDRCVALSDYLNNGYIAYKNRIRQASMLQIQRQLDELLLERNKKNEAKQHEYINLLWMACIILLLLFGISLYLIRLYRKSQKNLSVSAKNLEKANRKLEQINHDLEDVNGQLKELNKRLLKANEQQADTNHKLSEANYVKEEYIGQLFALCSGYISKLENWTKTINKKVRANQFEDLKTFTNKPTLVADEMKDFYQNFDAIFMNIYPDFISDFNSLLKPEAQILPKEKELLNTELRIYALVRLGIKDSVKIAEFLHCSTQTVYNYRLRIRNNAIVPKDNFAEIVANLGKVDLRD